MVAVLRKVYGGFMVPTKVARYQRGQQWWKGESAYNPWTHISHKELIYLLQKFTSPRSKVLLRMLLGEGLVGVNHHVIPTSTHKEGNQKSTPCNKFVAQLLQYVHATGLANFNTSISQFHNYPTSMTLISPSSCLKTIIKNQTCHSIQCTLYESFYYIPLGCISYQD